jgi:hypothetical protein
MIIIISILIKQSRPDSVINAFLKKNTHNLLYKPIFLLLFF